MFDGDSGDFAAVLPPPPPSNHHRSLFSSIASLGLGFSVAIALFSLLLLAALLIASYYCFRSYSRARYVRDNPNYSASVASAAASAGVVLPRIIFVAEDNEDESNIGDRSPVGLDSAAISSYPKFPYLKNHGGTNGGDTSCAICLCEYREGEMLRMLPDCRHRFHLLCVDAWLRLNASCPVCRTSPMPTPISTPLSELVPLSHYPSGQRRR